MKILLAALLLTPSLAWGTNYGQVPQTTTNNSQAIAGAVSGASATSSSRSSNTSSLSASTGESSSSSGVSTGAITVTTVEGNQASARAATILPQVCQTGMSAQTVEGGFGIIGSDQLCDYWRAATIAREAYEYEATQCKPTACTLECKVDAYVTAEITTCEDSDKALEYLEDYHHNLDMAQELIDATEHTSTADRAAGQLLKPLLLIMLLIAI